MIYSLPTAKITNPDVTRIINSDEIQSVVRPANAKHVKRPWTQHKNPLRNKGVLFRLNPYAKTALQKEKGTLFTVYICIRKYSLAFAELQAKAKSAKKAKGKAASKEFLETLFAP